MTAATSPVTLLKGSDPVLLVDAAAEQLAEMVGDRDQHEVVDLYLAEAGPGLAVTPDPAEVAETRWAEVAALRRDVTAGPERYTPWLRIYLAEHSGAIFG